MFTEEHLQLFTKFRVRTFGHKIQEMLDDPDYDDVSFEHKIVEALEAEQLARTNRKIEKYLKAAKFKNPEASVEDIHYRPDLGVRIQVNTTINQMELWAACGASLDATYTL